MTDLYNIYCDESCHLEHDGQTIMAMGALWCPQNKVQEIANRIKEIRARHSLPSSFEIKWTKVGSAKTQFYIDLIDYFFDDDDLHFRGLIVPDKSILNHAAFGQTHDDWYYKMYFELLKVIIDPVKSYRIYLDIKDTRSADKISKLKEVLANAHYDFSRSIIKDIISIRSEQVILAQITDLILGAVSYLNRKHLNSPASSSFSNTAKFALVERIQKRSGYSLFQTTLLREQKTNIFVWNGDKGI